MKRLTNRKVRKMTGGNLIREIRHINLEGMPEVDCILDCEKVIERMTKDILKISPDYYQIGSYLNIPRRDIWMHQISVFYYEKLKGGVNENV